MLIAHLSDPHLTTGVLAAEPAAGLRLALGRMLALEPRPDCVVITGDLTDHGRPEEYRQLAEVLDGYPIPVHLVTGNHDGHDGLLGEFGGGPRLGGADRAHYSVEYPEATIVALDALVEGTNAGTLGDEQLAWLDGVLAARADVPALVCLHHPPIPVGIPFMDSIRLTDGPALRAVLSRHRHVVRVLAGHLHRVATASFAGSTLTVAPSTYRQLALEMRPDAGIGYLAEPTGGLLHILTGEDCVTHTVSVSHSAAPLGGY